MGDEIFLVCGYKECSKVFAKPLRSRAKTCSKSCAVHLSYQEHPERRSIQSRNAKNPDSLAKKKATSLERHGVENYSNFEKQKETRFLHHGVETTFELAEIQKKARETNLQKYGYENPFLDPKKQKEIQAKSRSSLKKKYGVSNPAQIPGVSEKIAKTKIEGYRKSGYRSIPEVNFTEALGLKPGFLFGKSVDGLSLEKKLVFEYDGSYFHSFPERILADRRITGVLLKNGFRVIRVREAPLESFAKDFQGLPYFELLIDRRVGYSPKDQSFVKIVQEINTAISRERSCNVIP